MCGVESMILRVLWYPSKVTRTFNSRKVPSISISFSVSFHDWVARVIAFQDDLSLIMYIAHRKKKFKKQKKRVRNLSIPSF